MSFQILYTRICNRCGAATATEEITQDSGREEIVACINRLYLANKAGDYCLRCAEIVQAAARSGEVLPQ